MTRLKQLWKEWELTGSTFLVLDDDPDYAASLADTLQAFGAGKVIVTHTKEEALSVFNRAHPELAIVDYHLGPCSGIDAIAEMQSSPRVPQNLPVVMLTGSRSAAVKREALERLITDFVVKEDDPTELILRVGKALRTSRLVQRVQTERTRLEIAVEERTRQLARAQQETFDRLVGAAALRDDDTAEHTGRVGRLARDFALDLGYLPQDAVRLGMAAELHDIGKIGIPDGILRKPGPLTPEERIVMETHTTLGADLLEGCTDATLVLARTIVLTHHEHWDGSGYPYRLTGEGIPLAGRIVAVADAFDAMTKDRPYRKALPIGRALSILRKGAGRQWDCEVVRAFEARLSCGHI